MTNDKKLNTSVICHYYQHSPQYFYMSIIMGHFTATFVCQYILPVSVSSQLYKEGRVTYLWSRTWKATIRFCYITAINSHQVLNFAFAILYGKPLPSQQIPQAALFISFCNI